MGDAKEHRDDPAAEEPEGEAPGGDLQTLPRPPKRYKRASLVVMLATTLVAGSLAWSLRGDVLYAMSSEKPLDVGDLSSAELADAVANRYVRAQANLDRSKSLRYQRLAEAGGYRVLPVNGSWSRWVEHRVPPGYDGPRFRPPSFVVGRLVRVRDLGQTYYGMGAALNHAAGADVAGDAWLLVDGSHPRSLRWVVALVVMLGIFVAWNVLGLVWILRKPSTSSS